MIRSVDGMTPTIADSAYIDEQAVVIGDVTIGENASVWPGAVLRGDAGHIEISEGVNIQDNAICHEGVHLEPHVTVGHAGIVHAANVGERSVIGMNAVVLDDSDIGHHSIVAAGSVATEGTNIPPYSLAVGTPAEVKQEISGSDWFTTAENYMERADIYKATAKRID